MSKMHSAGSMKRVARLQSNPSEARFAPREKSGIAQRQPPGPALARANSFPRAMPATTPADHERIDPWSWMIASFIEGFALYGVSFHGIALFPVDPHPAETDATQPKGNSFHARRRHISLVSSCPRSGAGTSEFESGADPIALGPGRSSTTVGAAVRHGVAGLELGQSDRRHWLTSCAGAVVILWTHWRRERAIKKSVAALASLDDLTLYDMGIPHRSQIEQTVRYCHDC
jgi:uncharacterized protein YjiS (DUF1127 family)